ncbi:MAG: M20 metallopeptidase family protein [Crocinitomicaceae bacterium]
MNSELINIIRSKADELFDKIRDTREHIHAHPELSYQEHATMTFVFDRLVEIGLDPVKGVGGTGVVALITNDSFDDNAPCIGLRADLDALPITEANDVPYKSKNPGVMHACGHDVHTSILLGAAEILYSLKDQLPHPVKLVFQPGEEKNPGGATLMIKDGVLKDPEVKSMYALHVFPELPAGEVGFKDGLYMASCDEIHMTINGRGGHGAMPHNCIDPIMIGATLITQLQQVVSRHCDPKIPCVLSFGHFEAIGATNVIPERAHIKGTFRTMNEEWRSEAHNLIESKSLALVESYGATLDLEISKGYPFLMNDTQETNQLKDKAINSLGNNKVHDLPIRMTAEDFSYYSQEVPVCFFRLGVRNEAKGIIHGVHHPKFDIEPEALKTGMIMMTMAAF